MKREKPAKANFTPLHATPMYVAAHESGNAAGFAGIELGAHVPLFDF